MANEIGGHDLVLRVLDDALVGTYSGTFDSGFHLFVGRGFLDVHNKVDDGYVQCGYTECEVAILGSKGKSKQTKDMSSPLSEGMTLPTALVALVEEGMMLLLTLHPPRQSLCDGLLSRGGGVDGSHQTIDDTKVVVNNFGERSEVVIRAECVQHL